jgi:L-alanine-DL-glutamate epimerase-like enolase superfamily enzyme
LKLKSFIYDLELKHPFGISRGSRKVQKTLIVEIEHKGFKGLGEVTENAYYGKTVEGMHKRLGEITTLIEAYPFQEAESFWDFLHPHLIHDRFLHAAIDVAANDLYGKIKNKPLYHLWGQDLQNIPLSNFTIGLDSIDRMKKKLVERPWPLYKIKLGTEHDLEIIKALRALTDSPFRIDANTAWTAEETIQNSFELKKLGVEFIEQPLPHDAWDEMKEVKKRSALPIVADEACRTEDDISKCARSYHGVNVKLMKAGGLTPARRMLIESRKLGLKTMVGCMTESSVGISAVSQLLPYLDYVDMDGALLLKEDIATGPVIENGKVTLPDLPGTGAQLK